MPVLALKLDTIVAILYKFVIVNKYYYLPVVKGRVTKQFKESVKLS